MLSCVPRQLLVSASGDDDDVDDDDGLDDDGCGDERQKSFCEEQGRSDKQFQKQISKKVF